MLWEVLCELSITVIGELMQLILWHLFMQGFIRKRNRLPRIPLTDSMSCAAGMQIRPAI